MRVLQRNRANRIDEDINVDTLLERKNSEFPMDVSRIQSYADNVV